MTVTAKQRQSARPPASTGASSGASGPARVNAFPKSARLLKHPSFQHVYENGRKQFSGNMIFFYLLKPVNPTLSPKEGDKDGAPSIVQIGLTVGRALGGSVDRNRIKRRMRDVVRHNLAALQDALSARGLSAEVVINPKKAALAADIAVLRGEVERGFGIIGAANANMKPEGSRSR